MKHSEFPPKRGGSISLDLIQLRCFANCRCSIKRTVLVTGKSLRYFPVKGVLLRMTPWQFQPQAFHLLLAPIRERHKWKNSEPAPSIPSHVRHTRGSLLQIPGGKARERVVVNHSKERRETKWGASHGHGLNFSQLKKIIIISRGSVCFRPLSAGWWVFSILRILVVRDAGINFLRPWREVLQEPRAKGGMPRPRPAPITHDD